MGSLRNSVYIIASIVFVAKTRTIEQFYSISEVLDGYI